MKKYTGLALFLFFFSFFQLKQAVGQNSAEPLIAALTHATEDSNKVNLLNQCSYLLSRTNPEQGIVYSTRAKELAEKLNWQKGLARAFDNAALCYNILEDTAQARQNALKSIEIARKINDSPTVVSGLIRLSFVAYHERRQMRVARAYGEEALKLAQDIKDPRSLAFAYMNLGFIVEKKRESVLAFKYDSLAIGYFASINDNYFLALALINLAQEYALTHNEKLSLDIYAQVLELLAPFGNTENKSFTLMLLSNAYYKKFDNQKALDYRLQALEVNKQLNRKHTITSDQIVIARIYFAEKIYTEARKYATVGHETALANGSKWAIRKTRRLLKRIDKRTK